MRILIYVLLVCFILQRTSAFDFLGILHRAVGITNQSRQQYQMSRKTSKINR